MVVQSNMDEWSPLELIDSSTDWKDAAMNQQEYRRKLLLITIKSTGIVVCLVGSQEEALLLLREARRLLTLLHPFLERRC